MWRNGKRVRWLDGGDDAGDNEDEDRPRECLE